MIRGRSIFTFCYVTNLLIQSVFVLATLFNWQTLSQTLVLMLTTVGATTLIYALLQGQKKEKSDEKC